MSIIEPALLYRGKVGHVRHTPFVHKFNYRIWMLAVDLDGIDELAARSRIFSHNRRGLVSLWDRDHGARDGSPLRPWVEAALRANGLGEFNARIRLITMPRVFGYAFNPISFFFCYDASGRLGAVLHQVKNTFGGQVGYLIPVTPGTRMIRQHAAKMMAVSPLFDMQGGYDFTFTPPGDGFAIAIKYKTDEKRMTATMALRASGFSDWTLTTLLAKLPLTPLKVMGAIHWQALLMYVRGAKFYGVPETLHESVIIGENK